MCYCAMSLFWFAHIPFPPFPPPPCVLVSILSTSSLRTQSKPWVNSNLQSLFYGMTSMIDYFKGGPHVGVVDRPPWSGSNMAPHRRLQMDIWPTPHVTIPVACPCSLTLTLRHPKVCYSLHQVAFPHVLPFVLFVIGFGLPPQTNPPLLCQFVGCVQSESNMFQRRLVHQIRAFLHLV